MTLREMTYDLKMELQNNILSDDSRLSDRRLRFWIKSKRYDFIKKRENQKYRHDQQLVQNMAPLVISTIDSSLDPVNLPVGYSIKKSNLKIPRTIYFNEMDDGIRWVGPLGQIDKSYTYVPFEDINFMMNSKYNSDEIFAFRLNDYLYLKGKSLLLKTLSWINVRGIFADPMDLASYTDQNGKKIFSIDHTYPINDDLWKFMKDELFKTNIESLTQVPADTTNDASDQDDYQQQNQ